MTTLYIEDLPIEELRKSATFTKYEGKMGTCMTCQEPTEILFSCCSHFIFFEGAREDPNQLWMKIEEELIKIAVPDFDALMKDSKNENVF